MQTASATIPCHFVAQGAGRTHPMLCNAVPAPETNAIDYIRVRMVEKGPKPHKFEDINPYARSWGGDAAVFGQYDETFGGSAPKMRLDVRMEEGIEDYAMQKRRFDTLSSDANDRIRELQASGASKADIEAEQKYLKQLKDTWELERAAAKRAYQVNNEPSMGLLHHLASIPWYITLLLPVTGCWFWLVLFHIRPKRVLLWLFWGTIIAGGAGYVFYSLQPPPQTQRKNKRTANNLWQAEDRRLLDDMIERDKGSPYSKRLLAIRNGGDVNACLPLAENTGVTALMWASQEGHSGIVRILLEKGANPNAKIRSEGCHGFTALMFAAQNGYTDIVHLLQEKGADPDAVIMGGELNGQTASMRADQNGHDDIVRMLQDKEVSPDRSY